MKVRFFLCVVTSCISISLLSCIKNEKDLPAENAVLTHAPDVPPVVTRKHPAKVVVNLEVREVVGTLADGVEYTFWIPDLFCLFK